MHEDNFPSCWLREDTEGKAEEVDEMRKRNTEKERKSGQRAVEGEIGKDRGGS